MRQREIARMVSEDEGLHVLAAAAPCRRVAHMADGHAAVERRKVVAVEDLGHQPLALDRREAALLGTDDAARLLAAVLQGMKAVVDDSRRIVHAEDAEDAALLVDVALLSDLAPGRARRRRGAVQGAAAARVSLHHGPAVSS